MAIRASAAFATRSERALVLSVVGEDFGDLAGQVAETLLRAEGLRLSEVAAKLQRPTTSHAPPSSVHHITGALLKLLQHNLLDVTPVAGRSDGVQIVTYKQANESFGVAGQVIMEEVLLQGRVRMDQSLETMAYNLADQRRLERKQGQAQEGGDQSCRTTENEGNEEEEVSEHELDECRDQVREVFVEMAKKRYISRVHPLEVKVAEPKEAPDFPASITRGQEKSRTTNANIDGTTATTTDADKKRGTAVDEDGLTVRKKKREVPSQQSGNAIPVELQMMLDADEAARNEKDDSEAEWEPSPASTGRASKRKKSAKRAKLPTWGTLSENATAGGETSGEDVSEGSGAHTDERSLVWRFGVTQLLRDLRHKACIRFATENVNAVAGAVVAAMLQHSSPHEREKDEPTSFPVSARELFEMESVKKALPAEANNPWRLLLNYMMVMCRDKSGMVMKVAHEVIDSTQAHAGDGGRYVVHMQKIVEFLQHATTHAYIQEKYGVASARIVRLLLEKRQLEQKTIGELALLPSNDARHRLYELYTDKLLILQEISKRADHNPAFTFYCWSVDVPKMQARIADRVQDSLCRLRRRRKFEAEENKELIARSEQLVEANDLDKFDKLSRSLDRLDRAATSCLVKTAPGLPSCYDSLLGRAADAYDLSRVPRGAPD
uniref:DNA-directed RNA polymerase III subunit RPC3 n=1 Tax=Hyaloperonospora arabidopsidis (strain Emoy2) TaxID=559515 RepID=M4BZK8_HYAAE